MLSRSTETVTVDSQIKKLRMKLSVIEGELNRLYKDNLELSETIDRLEDTLECIHEAYDLFNSEDYSGNLLRYILELRSELASVRRERDTYKEIIEKHG